MQANNFEKAIEILEDIKNENGDTQLLIFICIVISLLFIWIYTKYFLISYAKSEFNKSLAILKSDLYESVGNRLVTQYGGIQSQLTNLSSQLGVESASIISSNEFKRNAILNYLEAYSQYLHGALELDVLGYEYNNYEDIDSELSLIKTARESCNIASNKMKFWTNDPNISKTAYELDKSLMQLSHKAQTLLSTLRHNLKWGNSYLAIFNKMLEENTIEKFKEFTDFLVSEDTRIRNENKKLIGAYWEERLPLFEIAVKRQLEFRIVALENLEACNSKE